jgi:hypothetical protein
MLLCCTFNNISNTSTAGPSGCAVSGVCLRPLAYCDLGFETHGGHGCISVVCVVCCQVDISAMSWSVVQSSSTDCGASFCVIKKLRERGWHSPRWAAEPEKIIIPAPGKHYKTNCYNNIKIHVDLFSWPGLFLQKYSQLAYICNHQSESDTVSVGFCKIWR